MVKLYGIGQTISLPEQSTAQQVTCLYCEKYRITSGKRIRTRDHTKEFILERNFYWRLVKVIKKRVMGDLFNALQALNELREDLHLIHSF